jgi:hypothetical protein
VAQYREMLARSQLSIVSTDADLDGVARTIAPCLRVGGALALAEALRALVATEGDGAVAARTLDLFGHSTADAGLLRLGDWVIDDADPAVVAWFRELARAGWLPRLGVRALRLLACRTAATPRGRATIATLADVLGIEVFGTPHLLYDAHHDARGFRAAWEFLLVGSSAARGPGSSNLRTLDVDALPARPLGPPPPWPRRFASRAAAARILALVDPDAGARLGTPAVPLCELALPASPAGAFHTAEVLHGGAFLQLHLDGDAAPGVAFPVTEPDALLRLISG